MSNVEKYDTNVSIDVNVNANANKYCDINSPDFDECLYELYKDDFIPPTDECILLFKKAKSYINLFDQIPSDLWQYILSNIINIDTFYMFLNEPVVYPQFQIPVTKFGIFLYNNSYEYILFKFKRLLYNNIFNLENYTKDYIYNYIQKSKINLKAFINFVYSCEKNNPLKSNIISTNSTVLQHKTKNKIELTICDLFRNINCCLNNTKCNSFKNACLLGHYYCIKEYINQGFMFSNKEINAALLSNNIENLVGLYQLGIKYSKLSLSLACNFELLNTIYYLCSFSDPIYIDLYFNHIFYFWYQRNANIKSYLKSIEFIIEKFPHYTLKLHPFFISDIFKEIFIDSIIYPNLYSIKIFYTKVYHIQMDKIEYHLSNLFSISNYYKLF
jgi:hypothetical protein